MKRLLCIVSSLSAGGAETFLMKIFRKIDKSAYCLDFIVSENTNGIYEDEVKGLGGRVYEIPLRTKKPVSSFVEILKIVRKNKYKYVLKMCDTPKGITDIIAAKMGGARLISVRSCNSSTNEGPVLHAVYTLIRPLFVQMSDRMIAPSKMAAEYTFGKKQLKNVTILHNAIDLDYYSYNEQNAEELKKNLTIAGRPIIGHVGRFTKQKNQEFLIKIFYEIKKKKQDAVLVLIGDGPLIDEIKQIATDYKIIDSVIFYGVTKDIGNVMSMFDEIVFPSLYEGLPNVIVEAQCVGIPCLISSNITDEVRLTELVHMMPLNETTEKWADKAIELLNVPKKTRRKELAAKGYDIKEEVSKFIRATME